MKGTKTSLFLIELMISLLLFAFCAAICIQLFHASNKRTQAADDLAKAVFQATTAAELYKSSGGEIESVAEYYGELQFHSSSDSGVLTLFFNENWDGAMNPALSSQYPAPGAAFNIEIADNGDNSADITVYKLVRHYTDDGFTDSYESIFEITVKAVGV